MGIKDFDDYENEQCNLNWDKIIVEWGISGEGQEAFCKNRNFSYNQFLYHRAKHKEQQKRKPSKKKIVKPPKTDWLPFKAKTDKKAEKENYSLSFPSGITLTIPSEFNKMSLNDLISFLRISVC